MNSIYDMTCQRITGEHQSLADYRGKVLLIVNTASQCGFTPQFTGLEALYNKYRQEGFEILGFPCNQFKGQDPGSNEEILTFCQSRYHVTFPMFSKVEVNGPNAHPLFRFLKSQAPGLLGSEGIKWNFTKFLIDQSGTVRRRFAPMTKPEDLDAAVLKLLHGSESSQAS